MPRRPPPLPVVEMKTLAPGESAMDEMLELGRQRGYPSQRHAAAVLAARATRHTAALAGVSLDLDKPVGPTIKELIASGDLPAPDTAATPQPTPGATER